MSSALDEEKIHCTTIETNRYHNAGEFLKNRLKDISRVMNSLIEFENFKNTSPYQATPELMYNIWPIT